MLRDLFGRAGVAQTPACHRKRLGKSVDIYCAVAHPRQGRDRDILFILIGQLGINLIGKHEQVVLDNDIRNRLQILAFHDRSGRIVRKWQDEDLGLVRDSLLQLLRRQTEIVFFLQLNDLRHAACQHRAGQIGHVARLRDQHLIARIDHRPQRNVNGFAAADRHKDLRARIVGQGIFAIQVF